MSARLPFSEVQTKLASLKEWTLQDSAIESAYSFPSFSEAIAFVNQVAQLAEERDHHPDIQIAAAQVQLKLTTHSCGGLSQKDFEMARLIQTLWEKFALKKG